MSDALKNKYDSLYGSEAIVFGGGQPIRTVRDLPKYLEKGTVLDVGGGEGRNALFLAQLGYDVSVVDLSKVGLQKLQSAAELKGLKIKTEVRDVVEDGIASIYDVIIFSFVLHHVDTKDVESLINETKNCTEVGGIHLINTFANNGKLYERNKPGPRFYPSESEIRELYKGWEIIELLITETTTHARDKEGNRMKNDLIEFVARKV